ncbi:MAG: clostripain-related cysteine peptidase [Novosphingobium sp.]|nr:clostripain-related cysteine peptidase [Novosphingobium sp.]
MTLKIINSKLKYIFLNLLILFTSIDAKQPNTKTQNKIGGTYTIGVYIAADNDLFPFAGRNIKQMQNIGSNQNLNIVVHFNMHKTNGKKISKRFLIKKDKLVQIGPDFSADSGNVNTLLDFCKWQIENFPADNQILILWNHGTGIIEPNLRKAINPSHLFNYNPKNKLIELNRNINFFDYINSNPENPNQTNQIDLNNLDLSNIKRVKKTKGICFDDTTHNYITNKELKHALEIICKDYLKGKKLAILVCDACLMSMIEVVAPLKNYVNYFVSSQEVVLGTGYDYTKTMEPLLNNILSKERFVEHIVKTYRDTYGRVTHDFTQSAINVSKASLIEHNLKEIVSILMKGLEKQDKNSVKEMIRTSKHRHSCTHFDEISYIDLGHFYYNLLNNLDKCNLKNIQDTKNFKKDLTMLLKNGLDILNKAIVANVAGKNLKNATGISIYFPERNIHSSYFQSTFAAKTKWIDFLKKYINN